jgi:DNA repair exonuclease SbcCD ATPase subunit
MIVTNYYVQHILKTYSQQLSVRSRISKEKINKHFVQKDEVTISEESKKRMIVDKITHEILDQLTNGTERNVTSREILNRLSQEYGHPLDVATDNGDGIVFKVLNEDSGEVTQYLPPTENEQLRRRLFDIAQSVVYDHLI